MFGKVQEIPQTEKTNFYPRSPYAVAKLYAHWITINYREAYGIYACNGILFNHESPVRGETFVTKKITKALCRIKNKKQKKLYLGNLNAKRDWGHAKDYVEAMWLMLQTDIPDDYVCSTGVSHSVKDLCEYTFRKLDLDFTDFVSVDEKHFRPEELYDLTSDPWQTKNIASDSKYSADLDRLRTRLTKRLKETNDPRQTGGEVLWDYYPYYGVRKNRNWKVDPMPSKPVKR